MRSIRTKFIIAILFVTLLPVLPLYFIVNTFFEKSLRVGFNAQVEQALGEAAEVSRRLFVHYKVETLDFARKLAATNAVLPVAETRHGQTRDLASQVPFVAFRLSVFRADGQPLQQIIRGEPVPYPPLYRSQVKYLAASDSAHILQMPQRPKFISAFAPLHRQGQRAGFLILTRPVDTDFLRQSQHIVEVNQMFKTLGLVQEDLQRSFIFAFFVVYVPIALISLALGYFFSKKITRPLITLAEGTQKVAAGNLDYRMQVSSRDEVGQLVQAFNTMIRKIKAQQEQVVALERRAAWREMARVLAHEIKNPLTPIQLMVQQLRDKYPGENSEYARLLQECTGIITDEINTLQTLAREFSEFARMPELHCSRSQLNRLVEEVQALYTEVPVHLQLDAALPECDFDVEKMRRVLINFFENSIHSIREKGSGEITIATSLQEGAIHLRFEDTGKGIPAERLGKIFEPYFSTKKHGMGLGLAIVKRIVEEHGGRIDVHSDEGKGTVFELVLPVDAGRG